MSVNARPYRLEIRDVYGRWQYWASYSKPSNAGTLRVYDVAYFGLRMIDTRTGRVVVVWSGRARNWTTRKWKERAT